MTENFTWRSTRAKCVIRPADSSLSEVANVEIGDIELNYPLLEYSAFIALLRWRYDRANLGFPHTSWD